MVKSTERPRRAPVGRASERQRRSDLICDRKTSCPPASSPSPLPSTRRISTTFESTFCTLRLLASLALLVSLPPRSATSSSPLSSVVHEPSRAKFISSAKYSRLRLRYRSLHLHFFFQLLSTSNFLSFFRLHLPLCLYQSLRFLQFIICNALRRLYVLRCLQTHPTLNLLDLFSPLFVIFFLNHLSSYILDLNHYSS